MEQLDTGVIRIKPRRIDTKAKGSLRMARDMSRIGHAALAGDPEAFDQMIDLIIKHSEVEAPGVADIHEALLDELSIDNVQAIMEAITGKGATVPPPNGG